MEKNIKILLIEDNSGDTYLIEEHLEELAELDDEAIGSYAVEKDAHGFFVKGQTEGRLLQSINTFSI